MFRRTTVRICILKETGDIYLAFMADEGLKEQYLVWVTESAKELKIQTLYIYIFKKS